MLHFFRIPGGQSEHKILQVTQGKIPSIVSVQTESCFNVEVINGSLSEADRDKLLWLFTETFEPENTKDHSYFALSEAAKTYSAIVEVGPRLAFSTAWSSNCASMCQACRIAGVGRIERSRRYLIATSGPSVPLTKEAVTAFAALVHDRMTECVFTEPLLSFANGVQAAPVTVVPVLTEGKAALERLNKEKGLGFDDWDLNFYTEMFTTQLQRNPTDVECFDMGQSNSEHSRHWFFGGQMIIDGETKADTLFGMVKSTLTKGPESNSIIAFHDNSSSLRGFDHVSRLGPEICGAPCRMVLRDLTLHPILTAETHNFPTGVAPFAGAETGTGGRLRDVQATGRGAHTVAGREHLACLATYNTPPITSITTETTYMPLPLTHPPHRNPTVHSYHLFFAAIALFSVLCRPSFAIRPTRHQRVLRGAAASPRPRAALGEPPLGLRPQPGPSPGHTRRGENGRTLLTSPTYLPGYIPPRHMSSPLSTPHDDPLVTRRL